MQIVRTSENLELIHDKAIAHAISTTIDELEEQYQEAYQATQDGQFIVCEQGKELFQPLPELSFSLYEKIKNGEAEYIEELSDWYEIYILLNDNEGVLVFIPRTLLPQHPLTMIFN